MRRLLSTCRFRFGPRTVPLACVLSLAAAALPNAGAQAPAQQEAQDPAARQPAEQVEGTAAESRGSAGPARARSSVDRVRRRLSGSGTPAYVIVLPPPPVVIPAPVVVAAPSQRSPSSVSGERESVGPARYAPPYPVIRPGQGSQVISRGDRLETGPLPATTDEVGTGTPGSVPRGALTPGRLDAPPELPPSSYGGVREVERALFEGGLFRAVGINFEFGKSRLLGGAGVLVDPVGDVLQRYPDVRLEVGGHTDSVGGETANQRLSEARARTIVDYLVRQWGIDPSRLVATGYGEMRPLVTNDNPTGRTLNRRVEFVVIAEADL